MECITLIGSVTVERNGLATLTYPIGSETATVKGIKLNREPRHYKLGSRAYCKLYKALDTGYVLYSAE